MGFTRLLEKKPLCNEYLLAYQLTCSLLAGLLFLVERPASPMEETPWRWVGLLIVASFGAWIGFAYSTFRARASLELCLVSIVSKTKIIWSALLGASVFDERLAWLQLVGMMLILAASLQATRHPIKDRFAHNRHAWLAPIFLTVAIGLDTALMEFLPASLILFIGFAGTALLTPLLMTVRYRYLKQVAINAALTALCATASYYLLLQVLKNSAFSVVMAVVQSAFILDVLVGYVVFNEQSDLTRKVRACSLA